MLLGGSPERFKAPEAYVLTDAPGFPRPGRAGKPLVTGVSYYGEGAWGDR